jgi:hypothetical protein
MKRTLRVTVMRLLIASAVLSAGACATTSGLANRNNARIATLQPGMTPEQVIAHIGPSTFKGEGLDAIMGIAAIPNPFKTEMYPAGDDTFRLLYFFSQLTVSDGKVTDEELMPVVFKNGMLDGWGWSYWEGVAAQYSIRIRP